ncbi:hypothetical protein HY496_02330, partial [Candidatus Woesearchaeota archaeon]|nr:hypothetical protein [Candidatus Woesearchaeota archaeon]
DRNVMQKAIDEIHAIEQEFVSDVEHKIPATVDPDHARYVSAVADPIRKVIALRGSLGTIWNDLEKFHEEVD